MNLKTDSSEVTIANSALCEAACREIYAQRGRWSQRRLNAQPPFYTLGAASYLDVGFSPRTVESIENYLGEAGSLWSWAGEAVLTIVERVREVLEDQLREPVEYPQTLPPPGFHIFIGAAIPKTDCARNVADCGSSHLDMQYQHLPWERWYKSVDMENTISFTLPLKLPAAGGGLTIWKSLTLERLRAALAGNLYTDIPSAANATPGTTIPYTVGSIVIHNGHLLHQMAGISRASVTDERITLQGHGIFADGAWRLYW
jgi:hypothetical protein